MPAEWSPHECVWMAWPTSSQSKGTWKVSGFRRAKEDFVSVLFAIASFEPVHLIAANEDDRNEADSILETSAQSRYPVTLYVCDIDDVWVRDTGPTFCLSRDMARLLSVCWTFNSWGEKFKPYDCDARLGRAVSTLSDSSSIYCSQLTVEGGSLHTDGEGTLLITESSVLNMNRNKCWSREEVEDELRKSLGIEVVVWLPGLSSKLDPITDGHIDGIACFARPGVVLFNATTFPCDDREYARAMTKNRRALEEALDAKGRRLEIIDLPESKEALDLKIARKCKGAFCNSYINFYMPNGGVVAPAFGVPSDDRAADILRTVFPEREVVMVDVTALATGGGGIHCITQQQPLRVC